MAVKHYRILKCPKCKRWGIRVMTNKTLSLRCVSCGKTSALYNYLGQLNWKSYDKPRLSFSLISAIYYDLTKNQPDYSEEFFSLKKN